MAQRLLAPRTTAPKTARPDPQTTMAGVLRKLDPACYALARYIHSEVQRQSGTRLDFESWIRDAVFERCHLLAEQMVAGVEQGLRTRPTPDLMEAAGTVRSFHLVA